MEYEFSHFWSKSGDIADKPKPLEEGKFGYSIARPVHNKAYYYDVYKTCGKFRCPIEGWHAEVGPGMYEAVGTKTEKNVAETKISVGIGV